jgi:hypothetical protein
VCEGDPRPDLPPGRELLGAQRRPPDMGPAGSGGQGGQNDGKVGSWPPNRTLKIVWTEVRKCSGGVKNTLAPPPPPGLRSPDAHRASISRSAASAPDRPTAWNPQGCPRTWANSKALIGIFSQTPASTCEFWVSPVHFTFAPACSRRHFAAKRANMYADRGLLLAAQGAALVTPHCLWLPPAAFPQRFTRSSCRDCCQLLSN